MEYQAIQMCGDCIKEVINGVIEFTKPTCITEVDIKECINYTPEDVYLTKEMYTKRIIRINLNQR